MSKCSLTACGNSITRKLPYPPFQLSSNSTRSDSTYSGVVQDMWTSTVSALRVMAWVESLSDPLKLISSSAGSTK